MRQDVLDLHGQVESQLRVSGVGLPQQVHRIPGSVEKVRIAECHVLDPVGSELVDVRQHGIRPDHPHPPVVDDGDRAMATAVPASVRSLDCGSETRLAHPLETGVVVVRGQRGSLGPVKPRPPPTPAHALSFRPRAHGRCPFNESRLVLADKDRVGEIANYPVLTHAGVQTVEGDRNPGLLPAQLPRHRDGETHGGMHRHREGDGVGAVQTRAVPVLHCEIDSDDVDASRGEGRRRRGDVDRLTPQLVRGDEEQAHRASV